MKTILSQEAKQALLEGLVKALPHDEMMFLLDGEVRLRWDEMQIFLRKNGVVELKFLWRGELVGWHPSPSDMRPGDDLIVKGMTGSFKLVIEKA